MLIVTKSDFLKMKAGVVFARYEPCVFKEFLHVKTDDDDGKGKFFDGAISLLPTIDIEYWSNRIETGRTGRFETEFSHSDYDMNDIGDRELVAVLERKEVEDLIEILQDALEEYD